MHNLWQIILSNIPTQSEVISLAIAVIILIIAYIISYYAAKLIAPKACQFIEGKEEIKHLGLLEAVSPVICNFLTATIVAIALYAYQWGWHSQLLLIFSMAYFTARTAQQILRGLNIGFWSALSVSIALFIWSLHQTWVGLGYKLSVPAIGKANIGGFPITIEFIITAILVVIIFIATIRLGARLLNMLLERNNNIDDGQKLLIEKLANVAMIIIGFLLAMDILKIDLTALAFFSGAFGLAIGFGLQKTFGNLISGIILLMDRSIKPGDVIAIEDSFGWVNKIGIRAVSIITRDGKEHLIPNENMMTNEVENWSYSSKNIRVRIPVGVSYNSDIKQVEEILLNLVKNQKRILENPEPKVLIKEFGDNSVNFELRIWIKDPEEGVSNIKSDVMKQIWFDFEKNNIEFPFPQRDIHIKTIAEGFR